MSKGEKRDRFNSPAVATVRFVAQRGLLKPLVWSLVRVTVYGKDQIADLDRPFIAVANHSSHLDAPLVIGALPRPLARYLAAGAAADYFFDVQWRKWLTTLFFNAFAIERNSEGKRSGSSRSLLERRVPLLIFPEGGRSPDGWGQPFRGGAAYLSLRCEVPVVPIHLAGTSRILKKGRTLPSPAPTTVTFGAPLRPDDDESSHRFATRIEAAVAGLADEATTDWWQARRRAHASTTPSLSGPTVPAPWRRMWALDERTPAVRRRRRAWPDLTR